MNQKRLWPETLRYYVDRARPILIEVSKRRTIITYGELMDRLGGPGRAYIGEVLGRISEIELEAKRPKLSAVVVRNETWMVSGGFFGFPDTPSGIKRTTPKEWQNSYLSDADIGYWWRELVRVYRYWREHDC